ncbi:cupin domain-containing protein [Kitasatospora sp. MAP12-44]|uniref:JmjC domain-containing protein n=1 Tax=Kitasatospora sp. MAP12-44 TaxID=3035099 RepID=UPI0032AF4261
MLAIQISGEKRWRVHAGPADGNWEPSREDADPGEVLLDTVLRPGEVLYVPRGSRTSPARWERSPRRTCR